MGAGVGFIPDAFFTAHIEFYIPEKQAEMDLRERDRESYLEKLKKFKDFSSKRQYVEMHPFKHSSNEIAEWSGELSSEEADNIRENISNIEIHGLESHFYRRFSSKNTYNSNWTSEFNGQGILLCKNEDVSVVSIYSTDTDIGIGVVMNKDIHDFVTDAAFDHDKKWDWYHQRGLNWYKALEKKAGKDMAKNRTRCERMAKDILAEINSMYPIRFRTSAWTCSDVCPVGTFKGKPRPVVVHG